MFSAAIPPSQDNRRAILSIPLRILRTVGSVVRMAASRTLSNHCIAVALVAAHAGFAALEFVDASAMRARAAEYFGFWQDAWFDDFHSRYSASIMATREREISPYRSL